MPAVSVGADVDAEERRRRAISIFGRASGVRGTPADRFIRSCGFAGPLPPCCRFAELAYPREAKWQRHPVLVVALTGADDRIRGIQRVYLSSDAQLLAIADPIRALGPIRGAAARLAIGQPGATPGSSLIVAPSVAAAFALAGAAPHATVWAVPVQPERLALGPADRFTDAAIYHTAGGRGPAAQLAGKLAGDGIVTSLAALA